MRLKAPRDIKLLLHIIYIYPTTLFATSCNALYLELVCLVCMFLSIYKNNMRKIWGKYEYILLFFLKTISFFIGSLKYIKVLEILLVSGSYLKVRNDPKVKYWKFDIVFFFFQDIFTVVLTGGYFWYFCVFIWRENKIRE